MFRTYFYDPSSLAAVPFRPKHTARLFMDGSGRFEYGYKGELRYYMTRFIASLVTLGKYFHVRKSATFRAAPPRRTIYCGQQKHIILSFFRCNDIRKWTLRTVLVGLSRVAHKQHARRRGGRGRAPGCIDLVWAGARQAASAAVSSWASSRDLRASNNAPSQSQDPLNPLNTNPQSGSVARVKSIQSQQTIKRLYCFIQQEITNNYSTMWCTNKEWLLLKTKKLTKTVSNTVFEKLYISIANMI